MSSSKTRTYLLNTGSLSVITPCDRSSAWTLRVAPENTTSAPLVRSTIFSIKKHDRAAVASTPTCFVAEEGGGGSSRAERVSHVYWDTRMVVPSLTFRFLQRQQQRCTAAATSISPTITAQTTRPAQQASTTCPQNVCVTPPSIFMVTP